MLYEHNSNKNIFPYRKLMYPDYLYDSLIYAEKYFLESNSLSTYFKSKEDIYRDEYSFDNFYRMCKVIAKSIRTHWEYIRKCTVKILNREYSDTFLKTASLRNEDGTINRDKMASLIKRIEYRYAKDAPRIFLLDDCNLIEPEHIIYELADMVKMYMDERYIRYAGDMTLKEALEIFDEDFLRKYHIKSPFDNGGKKVGKRETKDIDRLGLFH